MQGVLIDDHRIHVDFSQSVRIPYPQPLLHTQAKSLYRYLGFLTLGEMQPTQSVLYKVVVLGGSRIWRKNDNTEL